MADQQEPTGNPEVIAALNQAYKPALTAFEQLHRQEHRMLKRHGYKREAKRFDKLVDHAHMVRHKILNRVERLGGNVDSEMGPVKVSDDIETAYNDTVAILKEIYGALGRATAVATSANDHVTHKLLLMLQYKVDKKIHIMETKQRQLADLGSNYILKAI